MSSKALLRKFQLLISSSYKCELSVSKCEVPTVPVSHANRDYKAGGSAVRVSNVPFCLSDDKLADIFITATSDPPTVVKPIELSERLEPQPKICFVPVGGVSLLWKLSCEVIVNFLPDNVIGRDRVLIFSDNLAICEILDTKSFYPSNEISVAASSVGGYQYICDQYNQKFLQSPNELDEEINAWLEDFSIRENAAKAKKAANPDAASDSDGDEEKTEDDGWVVVGRSKRVKGRAMAFTETNQKHLRVKERRKRKQKEMMQFYRHQFQSSKTKFVKDLQEKFERDRLIVARMKASRKFNPTN